MINRADNKHYPLISVVIPTRNRRELLVRALKSVLSQTYENIEVIIVDDNSTDGTFSSISKTFQKEINSKQVNMFQNDKLMGNAATRNIGISKSRGEYIAFLDDDDAWLPDKLEKQLEEILHSGVKACFCGTMWVENDKVMKSTIERTPLLSFMNGGPTSTWLLHRSIFDEIGVFDSSFSAAVDTDFRVRLNNNYKSCFVDELLCIHYYHDFQISSSNKNKIIGFQKLLEKHETIFTPYENSAVLFRLVAYYLLDGEKRFGYILKSIRYKPDLRNVVLLIIMLLPCTQFSKFLLNKVLDLSGYPKSLAGRYKKKNE